MPDYKKKKHSAFSHTRKKTTKENAREDIKMSPKGEVSEGPPVKVVRGKKPNYKKRFTVLGAIAAAVLLFVIIFKIVYPAGVAEGIKNGIALMGTGSYPAEFSGSRIIDVKSRDTYYFVLTSKQLKGFSNGGKELFSHTHGFENPVLKVSQSRVLVFEQGGKAYSVFTLNGLENTLETEQRIINADMSDSGVYALVLESEEYAAAVKVFNKQNESIYEWFSAKDIVNNVAVRYSGNKIAVSTFSAETGNLKSSVSILEFDSPTPIYTKNIENGLVYSLDSTYRSGVAAVSENEICVIGWSGGEENYHNDYSASMLRCDNGYVAVFNRENDKTDNKIAVLGKDLKVKAEVEFNGTISDIALRGKHIYCISDAKVIILDFQGNIIRETPCGFGSARAVITDSSTALIVSDSKIEKIELERD